MLLFSDWFITILKREKHESQKYLVFVLLTLLYASKLYDSNLNGFHILSKNFVNRDIHDNWKKYTNVF